MKSVPSLCLTLLVGAEESGHWWYGGTVGARDGPVDWYEGAGDRACAEVGDQSPIGIPSSAAESPSLQPLKLSTAPGFTTAWYQRNSHTTQVAFKGHDSEKKMKVTWRGTDFFMDSFHFHAPSEHTIDGEYYPMEAHHVHHDAAGNALVLAMMMKTGPADNAYYSGIWSLMDTIPDGSPDASVWEVTAAFAQSPYEGALPQDKSYYVYMGSFTTPPCTTNTTWVMLKEAAAISDAQLVAYRNLIQRAPKSQLQLCDTARCGGATPTGVADHMAAGTTWDASLGTNNRPIQAFHGRDGTSRVVTSYDETGPVILFS